MPNGSRAYDIIAGSGGIKRLFLCPKRVEGWVRDRYGRIREALIPKTFLKHQRKR